MRHVIAVARDFEVLLGDQAPLESYVEWLDAMMDNCVVKVTGYIRGLCWNNVSFGGTLFLLYTV